MDERIIALERQVKRLRGLLIILLGVLILGGVLAFTARPETGVLRAQGLIILDAQGRERILIGAPVPASSARVRTDPEKARQAWASRYPRFDWYAKLISETNGILILNEDGFDQVVIGDPVPDPNIGRRIAPSSGILINDRQGFERTGWGFFPALNRVVLGLDTDRGAEGVTLVVNERGESGLMAGSKDADLFLGNAAPGSSYATADRPFSGLLLRQGKTITHNLNAFEAKK